MGVDAIRSRLLTVRGVQVLLDRDRKEIIISFYCGGGDYTIRLKPEQFIAIMDELGDAFLDIHLKKNLESFIDSEQQEAAT